MPTDPTRPTGEEDPAAKRWLLIQLARVIGVAAVLLGILIVRRVIEFSDETGDWLGYVLIVIGLFEVFFVPLILARMWSSRRVDLSGEDTTP